MIMHKAWHPTDDVNVHHEKKVEEDLPSLKTPLTYQYNDSKTT